jgi:hypothetical protein
MLRKLCKHLDYIGVAQVKKVTANPTGLRMEIKPFGSLRLTRALGQ